MKRNPSPGSRTRIAVAAGLLLAGLLLGVASPAAKAGNLDVALLERAGAAENVLIELHEKGYKNVGVLPFHVDRGPDEKSGYDVAPIALNLATRLENALILSQDPKSKKLVGIIRDAAGTAPPAGLKAYQSDKCSQDALEELFVEQYDLAWGDRKVKADAFITGRVINPAKPDSPYVKVIIEVFDSKWDKESGGVKRQLVQELCVRRDRALLADLGVSFTVPGNKLTSFLKGRGPSSEDRDGFIGSNGGWGKSKPKPTPEDVGGMAFTLYYGKQEGDKGAAVPVKINAEGVFEAPPPPVGSTVTLALKHLNKDKRTRAVVIKMNGRSLWRMEEQDSLLCQKWLIKAGKSDTYEGYYFDTKGENMKPFVVEPVEKTKGKDVGPKLGWIGVDVFADAEADQDDKVADKKDGKKEDKKDDKDALVSSSKVISLRSAGPPATYDGKALKRAPLHTKPLAEVQDALQRENNVRVTPIFFPRGKGKGRGFTVIAAAGSAKPGGDLREEHALINPQPIASLAIKYYYGK